MATVTFVADQIYNEFKNDIMNQQFQQGEQITEEYLICKFNVSRSFANEALLYLAESGLLKASPDKERFYVRACSKTDYEIISKVKMIFINLSYAVQKLQEKNNPVCFDCLRTEMIKIKCATFEKNEAVFLGSIKTFYGCMIRYTEMRVLERNIDYLVDIMRDLEQKNPDHFFDVAAHQIIKYLESLIELLEKREFEKCLRVLKKIYTLNIQLLFT
ncbi:GntR family transcriptional regulator [Listeria costaricensis]|uniref:GntR family transcriptional regulator n=1 Tax=Listeria costaricensis TaxID=2026604 RepID=UPI0013C4B484|nr:GntR family transcriptional regulator [Listeria costaricensis]